MKNFPFIISKIHLLLAKTQGTFFGKGRQRDGYTLLFAVFTATLVLGVAVFILSVSKRQFELSVTARDSMYSIYAADSGIECAASAYAAGSLATTTPGSQYGVGLPNSPHIFCNSTGAQYSSNPTWQQAPVTPAGWTHLLVTNPPIYLRLNNETCAAVTVYNGYDPTNANVVIIESRGYNYCYGQNAPPGVPWYSPQPGRRTVERGLRLIYR